MANIKKGDLVQVIAGASKGKQGQVLAVLTADNKVIVQGINLKTRHTRVTQNDRGVKQGGIEQAEARHQRQRMRHQPRRHHAGLAAHRAGMHDLAHRG